MQAEHGFHRIAFEQSLFDHDAGAAFALFCGLEDHHDRTVKIAMFGKVARRPEQHGRVTIMTTGMHLSGMTGTMGKFI